MYNKFTTTKHLFIPVLFHLADECVFYNVFGNFFYVGAEVVVFKSPSKEEGVPARDSLDSILNIYVISAMQARYFRGQGF